ncbi:unnamed protein product [Paramecium octaurelia]|uniref:Transmembrane protein n=1 Tax=Paramecium octaurelia TaxID=43137 RepID=A0A8S1VZW4_PAROT|nr:unnamed protein product [Paramecium octaurelia]
MIAIVLLMQSFFLLTAYYIIGMNEDSQIQTYSVDLKLNNFGMDSYFGYGLWSRYSPLGSVLQVGQFGVLDSDCFHLHNAAQQSTNDLNLIVYDCLNYETKTIIRRIQFVTIDENWHLFEVELDELEYEYVWHYFEITQWPQRNRFELLVIKYPEIKLYSIQEDFQFPYKDTELLLTFGGGLQISQSNTNQLLKQLSQFSFFPGKFYLYPLSIGTMPITRNAANTALSTFQFRANCLCNYNSQVGIQDQELTWLDKIIFPSQKSNCDSYLLSTWIKIQNIFQSSPEFLYQVLKLSANFENPTLVNNNLAAFQLLYKITSSKNSLIVNTYSYTFPLVSINFDNDPFLIPKEFDLQHNINLWHYVLVILSNNELKIQIIFYEGLQQHHYNYELAVNQFRIVKFKLFYGNVKQLVYDYLSVKFVNTYFFNCAGFIILPQLECHESCLECDGPTNTDCLSCPINSNRIYIPEQKSCVCPYNTVEEIQCKDYQNYNFILVKEDNIDYKCLQGYFQYEGSCIKCPSVIRSTSIACLECVYQAQTWATNSFCSTTLYDDIQGGVAQFQQAKSQQYYIFDGDALQLRYYSNSKIIDEETNDDFTLTSMNFKNFCFQHQTAVAQWRSEKECYQCTIQNCQSCAITALAITCLSCDYYSKLKDGICIPTSLTGQIVINDCLAPFYYTSTYQCKICNIQNCKYCFEYLSNDLTKCTLYRDFESFKIDEYHQVGCALCNDDFIYDFTSGKCKHEKPNIDKCLRSYINLQGQEICTLSKIDDFKIAPEIINCQTYISNCKQCLMTPQNVIRCILCEDGYTTSITTGQCYQCLIQNARICIEGDYLLKDQWMQLIQSFLIQFLPNKYMYPKSSIERYTIELPQECQQGFRPDPYSNCIKYCDSNCLQCVLNEAYPYKFYCNKCPLDYYKKPLKSSEDGKCFQCPQLCSVCQSRTEEEIKMTNPYYILNEGTIIYTLKCLQQAPDDNVVIDPYTNIARYCYKSTCTDVIQYQFDVNCQNLQNLLSKTQMQFYQNNININYCNKLGIKKIVLYMTLLIQSGNPCNLPNLIEIYNDLRKKIYALQEVQLKLEGLGRSGCFRPIVIINFSIVEIINVAFEVRNSSYLKLENNQSPINLIINNSIIFGNLGETQQYSITLSKCGDLIIQDLQIINLNLLNSTILDYISLNQKSKIFIKNLSIFSSIFNNSILFAFSNLEQSISITNILIQDCQFYNSLIFSFNSKSPNQLSFIEIQNLKLVQSRMISSSLIITYDEISVNFDDIYIYKNQFNNSTLLGVSQNLVLQNTILVENIFMKSLFLFITEIEGQSRTILIDHLNVISNAFETSSIINTKLYISNAFTKCQIINLYMQNNHQLVDSGLHLFNLNIYSLTINGCLINYSINLNHFKLTEIQSIVIQNISYINKEQNHKVPLSYECLEKKEQNLQLFYISGFSSLQIQKIIIKNQFIINYSFIHILSNILQSSAIKEVIEIKDVIFYGNILLKQNLGTMISQISIYSEKYQEISLENIQFQEVFFNEEIDDPSQTSAGLIFLNSQQSFVAINNLTSLSNAVTNSSNTFIYINSNSVQINNITIKNHNTLNSTTWKKYYEITLENQSNTDQINYIVQSIFKFLNKGGIIQITSSNILITLGLFTEIQSQSSSIFDIRTQGQGVVQFEQLSISQAEVDLQSYTETQGCISIYSKNSLLSLKMKNVKFKNIFNRLSSSILSITPSQTLNKIEMQDVILESCLSLINQFMKIDFSYSDKNSVLLENLQIYQSESDWIEYRNKIEPISLSEVNKIPIDNAVINLNGCQLFIKGLISEGTFLSPILKVTDSQKILIQNCKINSVQTFFTFSIFQFIETRVQKSSIYLEGFHVKNTTLFKKSDEKIITNGAFRNTYTANKCRIYKNTPIPQVTSTYLFQQTLEYLNENISSTGSLIFVSSVSTQNIITLRKILVNFNNFSEKVYGIINFNLSGFQEIKLREVSFIQNNINEFGCLTFIANLNLESKIKIINSQFLFNNGTFGTAIYASKVIIDIKNSQFIKNIAKQEGGAIYMENCGNHSRIINSIILMNQAQQGGGLYFNGKNHINKDNFIHSLILLNYAEKLTDNIVELPHHLALSINQYKMFSTQEITENLTTNILKLNSYNIIEQGQLKNASELYLPSNRAIADFLLFNPKNQGYLSYFNDFSLFFENSINEKVSNFINITCKTQMFTQTQKHELLENTNPIQILPYDQEKNTLNLQMLNFEFDPYQNTDQLLLVQINCSLLNQHTLRYIFTAKTFKCQLGEFYVNNGCQVCQQSQGFYSVTYNTTKCSIFDMTRFSNITSNRIQLLKGFWRPHEESDYTELCFKQQAYCLGGWNVGNNLCQRGHVGGLCEECDNYNIRGEGQFFKDFENQTCQLCSKSAKYIFIFIAASLWSIFQILLTLRSIDKSNQLFYSLKLRKKVSKILFKLNQDHQSIQIKMFINFLWIFSLIFSFNIQFSFSFGFVDQISNPTNFMATSLDCYLLEFEQIQLNYSRIIATLLLIILQLIIMFVGSQILALTTKSKSLNSVLSNTGLYLYVSNFASLIKQFSSLLARRQISNIEYIQGNVSLMFDTQSHYTWMYRFIIPGLGFIGCFIPVFLFSLMFVMRKKLDMIKFRKHICYMFNEYAEHCYYWEFIKIWKKTILIIILTYFETNILLKASLLGLCLLFYQLFAVKIKPFINQKLNSLDLETGQFCSIAIFLAATIYVCEQTSNQIYSYLLQSSIILLFIKLCYPFIYQIMSLNYKTQKINVLTLLLKCSSLLTSNSTFAKHLNYKLIELKQREQKLKSNIQKLKQHLFSVSKSINENQKLLSSQQQFQNKSTFRILTSRETEVVKFMKTDQE